MSRRVRFALPFQQGVGSYGGAHLDGLDFLGGNGLIRPNSHQGSRIALDGGVGVAVGGFLRQQLVDDQLDHRACERRYR